MTPRAALCRARWTALVALWLGLGCALPQECPGSLDAALEAHVGQKVSLRDLTNFPWIRAHLFRSRAPAQPIRAATGVDYRPFRDAVPPGRNVIAFQIGEKASCLSSVNTFRFQIDLEGRTWLSDAPLFQVTANPRWRRWKVARTSGSVENLE